MGPPGCGKTRRAEMAANSLAAALVFYQCHAWTDADELFVGVDVAAAVAGDASAVRQEGVLACAARLSQSSKVVLVLDEIDKTSEKAEALLLDFLQNGRVPIKPSFHLQARLENLTVYLTSNNTRDLGDALLRRCRRVWMRALSCDVIEKIVCEQAPEIPAHIITLARRAAYAVAAAEGRDHVCVAEFLPLCREIWSAKSISDIRDALSGWAARSEQGAQAAQTIKESASLWAEILASRRSNNF